MRENTLLFRKNAQNIVNKTDVPLKAAFNNA